MALPLAGIRVLDLTRALSGPFCSMILADLGADVIKVEPMASGDMIRTWGPFDRGQSAYYLSTNRNKRGIAVNFRDAHGLELIRQIARGADVVVENFRSGVMEDMGLGYDQLAAVNPKLIFGSITGFGRDGPMGNWPGFDQIAQGYSGLMSLTGQAETGPTRAGIAIGDLTSGMWTAMGILAALLSRQHSGRGQRVETSLLASLVSLLGVQGQRFLSLNEVPELTGNVHPVIAPYGVFQTKDGPLNLAPATPDMWIKLCKLLQLEKLIRDPRFVDNAARMQHRDELRLIIEARLKLRTKMDWTKEMIELGIPAGPINNLSDVFKDPQVQHSRLVEEVQHPLLGALKQVANPIKLAAFAEGSVRMPPPMFGEHTFEVLAELGYSDHELQQLSLDGVIAQYQDAAASVGVSA
ncbi:CaiB/BaiF CoA transferase family protein [Noviherbaspirillum saxi]|uniref:CoA transferase n=1 Tax=Noviherbaspirillum saxi TaxID=2320863 RepID=A0A3A3FM02_9BURK|nr:CaiB/BaiF CoA-transferase family protein [Noviherbaspirillum saxi]RJF96214.1 CoA transferase [Noviherbaspirillum saxi]